MPLALRQRNVLDYEGAIPVEQLAINPDLAVLAHVADHVPVDGALIQATGFRIAHAHGHMHRPADFLVIQDHAGEAVDAEVGANCEFAQVTRARIRVQLRV